MITDDEMKKARRYAILNDPDGVPASEILDALNELEPKQAAMWLLENDDAREQVTELFDDVMENLEQLIDMVPDEKLYESVKYDVNVGIYTNTRIIEPDGTTHSGGDMYYWATDLYGDHLVDVKEQAIPPGVDLEECEIEIRNSDNIVLLKGEVVNEPNRTIGRSWCVKLRGML